MLGRACRSRSTRKGGFADLFLVLTTDHGIVKGIRTKSVILNLESNEYQYEILSDEGNLPRHLEYHILPKSMIS